MHKLHVIVASTRPTRVGLHIAKWAFERAQAHGKLDPELVDLKEVNLPIFDEPEHPRLRKYTHEHTRAWSKHVDSADAFTIVTPEYNYGMPPALLNALHYLLHEWAYKPVSFVSYGGVSGGTRSVQMAKQIVTTLKMMPLPDQVTIPMVAKQLNDDGSFKGGESFEKSATTMFDELAKWTAALKPMRG